MKSQKSFIIGNNLGFTLVELMITLAMSGIIVAAIYSAYIIQQKTYYTQGQVGEMQQNIRAGLEMMVGEIRAATYDPDGEAGASILVATPSAFQFTRDLLNDGDLDDANENVTYGLGGVDLDNNGVVDNIDANADGVVDATVNLTRNSGGGGQSIAEGIQAIEFYYILDDGTATLKPSKKLNPIASDLPKIQTVQITLLAVSSQRDPKYTNADTYSTASTIDKWGPFNDNFRRRLLSTSVTIRNHGLN